MPQLIGTKPLENQEEEKVVNDGDFELISKIRCFAGVAYDTAGEHAYNRYRGNHDLSVPLPARRLFYSYDTTVDADDSESPDPGHEEDVDIDSVEEEEPLVATSVANRLLNECEKLIEIYRPRPVDRGEMDDKWDEMITKSNWSSPQVKSFAQLLKILNSDRLSRLCHASHSSEAVLRRTAIERTAGRLRVLFTRLSWNVKLAQWLHAIIVDRAPTFVLLSYLEAMQVLYNKIPSLINQVINSSAVSLSSKNLGLDIITQIITKKCWDPVAPMLAQHKMPKLPLAPVFIVLGSEPLHDLPGNSRTHHWISLLTELGTVIPITSLQTDRDKTRMKISTYLDELLYTVRLRIQGARNEFNDATKRPIILVGINAGGALMAHTALFETNNVQGVVCVGFSVDTAEGKRGMPGDRLLELTCPTLFVIGQCATTATEFDMEQIRKRLKCISGLIVVGGADDQLRKDKLDLMREKVTQDIVDRAVINEVAAFLSKALTMPKPTVVPKPAPASASVVINIDGVPVLKKEKKQRGEGKDGKVKKNYYQEKKRKLAEMMAAAANDKDSPKKQKREVPEKNPKIFVVSAAPTILRTSLSNTHVKTKKSDTSPRKSLEESVTSTGTGMPEITIVAKPVPGSQGSVPQRKHVDKIPRENSHQSSLQKMLGNSPGTLSVKISSSTSILPSVKLPASTTIQPAAKSAGSTPQPAASVVKSASSTTATTTSSSSESNTEGVKSLQSLLKPHQAVKPVPPVPSQMKKKPVVTPVPGSPSSTRHIRVIKSSDKPRTFNITSMSNVRYITTSPASGTKLTNVNTLIPISSLPSGSQIRTVHVKSGCSGQLRPVTKQYSPSRSGLAKHGVSSVRVPTSTLVKHTSGTDKPPKGVVKSGYESSQNFLQNLTPIDILDAPIDILDDEAIEVMDVEENLVEEIEEMEEVQVPNVKVISINKSGVNVSRMVFKK